MSNQSNSIKVGERVRIKQRGKKGLWCADFSLNGEHKRLALDTANKALAERRARKLDVSLVDGTYKQDPKPEDIDSAIEQFIDFKRVEGRSKKTLTKYEAELKTFAAYCRQHGATKLHHITPSLHDRYRADRQKTLDPYTVHNHAITHKTFSKWCESRDLVAVDPLRKVRLTEPSKGRKWSPPLSVINAILATASSEPQVERMLAVLAFTGMRSGELVNLRPQDVDLRGNWVHIAAHDGWQTKTGEDRKVPIHPRLKPYLTAALKAAGNRPTLFCAPASPRYPKGDHPFSQDKLLLRLNALAKQAKVPTGHKSQGLVVHSLRHFFRTFCTNTMGVERAIDVWMGHVGHASTGALYYQLSDAESQALMTRVTFDHAAEDDGVTTSSKGAHHAA